MDLQQHLAPGIAKGVFVQSLFTFIASTKRGSLIFQDELWAFMVLLWRSNMYLLCHVGVYLRIMFCLWLMVLSEHVGSVSEMISFNNVSVIINNFHMTPHCADDISAHFLLCSSHGADRYAWVIPWIRSQSAFYQSKSRYTEYQAVWTL